MTAPGPIWVAIPAFNAARHIERAVASARSQHGVSRVVVVDDGSTDATASLAESAGADVIRQSNAGPAAARNRALDCAGDEGAFVLTLDADDALLPDATGTYLDIVAEHPSSPLLLGDYSRVWERRPRGRICDPLAKSLASWNFEPFAALLPTVPVTGSGLWFSAAAIRAGVRFEHRLVTSEDRELVYRACRGGKLVVTHRPVFIKHEVVGQMTGVSTYAMTFLSDCITLYERYIAEIDRSHYHRLAPALQHYAKRACRLTAMQGRPLPPELWDRVLSLLARLESKPHWRTWKWYLVSKLCGSLRAPAGSAKAVEPAGAVNRT